jgi:chitinase
MDELTVLNSSDQPVLREVVALKSRWPNLKVTVAVGGWTYSTDDPFSTTFSKMLSTQANRATFIASVQDHIRDYGLDGIDIDFEYPAAMERGGPEEGSLECPGFSSLCDCFMSH